MGVPGVWSQSIEGGSLGGVWMEGHVTVHFGGEEEKEEEEKKKTDEEEEGKEDTRERRESDDDREDESSSDEEGGEKRRVTWAETYASFQEELQKEREATARERENILGTFLVVSHDSIRGCVHSLVGPSVGP